MFEHPARRMTARKETPACENWPVFVQDEPSIADASRFEMDVENHVQRGVAQLAQEMQAGLRLLQEAEDDADPLPPLLGPEPIDLVEEDAGRDQGAKEPTPPQPRGGAGG